MSYIGIDGLYGNADVTLLLDAQSAFAVLEILERLPYM